MRVGLVSRALGVFDDGGLFARRGGCFAVRQAAAREKVMSGQRHSVRQIQEAQHIRCRGCTGQAIAFSADRRISESTQPEKTKHEENDDDGADQIDDAIHD